MEFKERVSENRIQIRQTILIIALIAAKLISVGVAVKTFHGLPKKVQAWYQASMAMVEAPPPDLEKFAENVVKGWDEEKWQAETDAILSLNAELKKADKAMETMDFDKAHEHLDMAQKMWAAAIKKFGRSKETAEFLNMIINLKQKNRVTKTNYLAGVKIEEVSEKLVRIAERIKTIKVVGEAEKQIARLQAIKFDLFDAREGLLKLSKQERYKGLLEMIDQLIADCDSISKTIMELHYPS